jgi:hypothetical protein
LHSLLRHTAAYWPVPRSSLAIERVGGLPWLLPGLVLQLPENLLPPDADAVFEPLRKIDAWLLCD